MALKLYPEDSVQAIASAIRNKNGSSDTYKIGEMASAINAIPSGGGGDNVFYITESASHSVDKTYEEIDAAYASGNLIVYKYYRGTGEYIYMPLTKVNESGGHLIKSSIEFAAIAESYMWKITLSLQDMTSQRMYASVTWK